MRGNKKEMIMPIDKLNRVRVGYAELQRLTMRVQELESIATHITPVLSQTPKGGHGSKDDTWATLIDYKARCESQLNKYIKDCTELEQELQCIRSQKIRTAMCYYYLNCYKQEDIANAMGYSDRAIRIFLQKGRKIYAESNS